ncbi:MAG: aminoacyl-tRNA hydrolase [Sedimenticola selenatireducens]|uniref:Peptidyl-tRNA hydrolase n=2 Tax=Sedimenticola selenatireducens TaxID=191960 RepID=A0A558DSP9_9GAMM|nr:aminoacyl-tRNA hydrolase [Sedimenticola selenatireducens]TVT64009.1 MAG: aminoacyl-tRNA hydrolase [Sedimenticola selenatireducens]
MPDMSTHPTQPIRLIVGLGNPGADYAATRHNAGFWFLDHLAEKYGVTFKVDSKFHGQVARILVGGRECWLLKPSTFMNRSGQSVSSIAKYYKIPLDQILVAHDELDMAPGIARLKFGGGHAGHNGLRDIVSAMGSKDFWRLRIGIDHPGSAAQVVNYVLGRPSKQEAEAIERLLDDCKRVLPELLKGEFQRAMNRLHVVS